MRILKNDLEIETKIITKIWEPYAERSPLKLKLKIKVRKLAANTAW